MSIENMNRFKLIYDKLTNHIISYRFNKIDETLNCTINYLTEYEQLIQNHPGYEYSTILKPFYVELNEFIEKFRSLRKNMYSPFMLFVVGTGNYGKSTLLNALMQQQVADVDFLPKTWKIDIFKASQNNVTLKFKNGEEKIVSIQEAKEFISQEEQKRMKSEKIVSIKYKKFKESGASKEELKEYKLALQQEELYESKLAEVHWPVKSTPLLEKFYLVDTPGLQQRIMGELKVNIREYYHKADGVLWMLDATAISAANSKNLINDLTNYIKDVGQIKPQNIIAVLNKIDLIRNQEGEEGVQRIIQEAKEIYKGFFSKIIPISAEEAFKGYENNDKKLIKESGIERLLLEIEESFLKQSKEVRVESKILSLKSLLKSTSNHLESYITRLEEDENQLKSLINHLNSEMDKREKALLKELDQLLHNHSHKVKSNIQLYAENLFDFENNKGRENYIKNKIFEIGFLSKKIEDLYNKTEKTLKEMFEYYREKAKFTKYKLIEKKEFQGSIQSFSFGKLNFNEENFDTEGLSFVSGTGISIISSIFLGPIGLLLGPLSGILGINKWIAKQFKLGELQINLNSAFNDSINEIQQAYEKYVHEVFTSTRKQVEEIAYTTFSTLHGDARHAEFLIAALKIPLLNIHDLTHHEPNVKNFFTEDVYLKSKDGNVTLK
ncbi:dynamin family protein [Aeribacillus kexueae]|uniref:dynamin family protein n=1 Tax=Aeribacillus kexueae TaxID=2078952 RepID=UPI001FAFD6D0|nr:dynamin family protein [Bacillus kexueae]